MRDGRRWYVISLRPRGTHGPLRAAAARAGHGVIALSPWVIRARDDEATRAALADALQAEAVVFTSPAAVRCARRLVGLAPSLPAVAVGSGTARVLRSAGVREVAHPERMDSEGLLALPGFRNAAGMRVGIVTAPGGRDAIAPALRALGAEVLEAHVYVREDVDIPPRARARVLGATAPLAIAASSAEALSRITQRADDALRARLQQARVLASSTRVAERASALGYGDIVQAAGPRPAQLIAALAPR